MCPRGAKGGPPAPGQCLDLACRRQPDRQETTPLSSKGSSRRGEQGWLRELSASQRPCRGEGLPRGRSARHPVLSHAGSSGKELPRPRAEPAWLGDSQHPQHIPPHLLRPLPGPLTSSAPPVGSAVAPHLRSHLSTTSGPVPASPPARGGGSARQSSPEPLGKLAAKPLPPWRPLSSRFRAASPPPPRADREGSLGREKLSPPEGPDRVGARSGYSRGGQRWESSSGSLTPTASGRRSAGVRCRLCRRRLPAPSRSRAGLEPPAPTSPARFIQLHSSAPGLCKAWRSPAANGAAAGARGPRVGGARAANRGPGSRGAGWGRARRPALI